MKIVKELKSIIEDGRAVLIGPIRQEVLSGIKHAIQFKKLSETLDAFPDHPISKRDYVEAASLFNLCRSKGVQGSNTDYLICSVAIRNKFSIFTTDKDFENYIEHIPISLHESGRTAR